MPNDNQNTRRLAAIIFADIVGYTAMMQDGEASALQTIKRFESITREYVAKYQGEVIKNYGDGSLMLFDSTVNAVQCAHDMQIAFQEEPKVPLRIGVHVGEVVRRDKDIFGHGVNISSRIESLGVAGSVLVSKMIYDKVRNQENFSFKSMGTFDFKNVDEGMQVYALSNDGITVPRVSEMKGKVKEVKTSFWSNPTLKAASIIGLIALGIGGIWGLTKGNAQEVATETVTYVDENGEEQSRLVYNRSMSNRVMMYAPKNIGDAFENEKWISLGIAELLTKDLELDNRLYVIHPMTIGEDMKSKGLEDITDLSFSLKRKFAADRYVDYFIDSEISKTGEDYKITFNAYNTQDGKKVLSKTFTNSDITSLADGFSSEFNQFLYDQIDQNNTEGIKYLDLPARELLSDSEPAIIAHAKAMYAMNIEDNFDKAVEGFDEALIHDPKLFSAKSNKGFILCAQGKADEGLKLLEESLNQIDEQPERIQLMTKLNYSRFQGEVKKAIRLGEMWVKLHPNTEEAYTNLARVYQMTGDFGKYQEVYKNGYDQGHKGRFLLTLGTLHTESEEFDEALKYFEEFQELYPDKTGEIRQLGDLYLKQGEFDKAIEYLENRSILDDQNTYNFTALGGAFLQKGDFDSARENYSIALARAKTAQDSVGAMGSIANIDYLEGKAKDYVELQVETINLLSKFIPPMQADMQYVNHIGRFKHCGALDYVTKKMKGMSKYNVGNLDWGCISQYNLAINTEDNELAQKCRAECGSDLDKATGEKQAKLFAGIEKGLAKEYGEAKKLIYEFIEENKFPVSNFATNLSKWAIDSKDYDEAIELLEKRIKSDRSSGETYVLLAKAYRGKGNETEATANIQKALDIWKNADSDYSFLLEANELLAELN